MGGGGEAEGGFTVPHISAQTKKPGADIVTARLPPQESAKTGLHAGPGLADAQENLIFFIH